MARRHSADERARDRRHNEAARREMARKDRERGPDANLERGAALQAAAEEFRRAFAAGSSR